MTSPPDPLSEPRHIDCAQCCEIPAGVRIAEVPEPRHAWSDVFRCPNEECGRWFLVISSDEPPQEGSAYRFVRNLVEDR